jgi:hypothetical protein
MREGGLEGLEVVLADEGGRPVLVLGGVRHAIHEGERPRRPT